MQIHAFLAGATGADAQDLARTSDQPPLRVAREFARQLSAPVDSTDPTDTASVKDGAPEEPVGEPQPSSPSILEITQKVSDGMGFALGSREASPKIFGASPPKFGPKESLPPNEQGALETGLKMIEPKHTVGQPPASQTNAASLSASLPRADATTAKETKAQFGRPMMPAAIAVETMESSSPVRLNPADMKGAPEPQADPAEAPLALSRGPAIAQPMLPEQTKALGLSRAPGLVGEGALPQTSVAKGIRETSPTPTEGKATSKDGRLPWVTPPRDTPIIPEIEAASEGNREIRGGKSQDGQVEINGVQSDRVAMEKQTPPAAVGLLVLENPVDGSEAGRLVESPISGPSGLSSQPSAHVLPHVPASGPGHAVMQQLAVAVRRSGEGEIEVALEPEELGKVRLTIAPNDTRVTVSVFVERPETLDLIRRHIDALTSDLRQQGYSEVALDFAQNRGEQSGRSRSDLPAQSAPSEDAAATEASTVTPRRLVRAGGLDLRL